MIYTQSMQSKLDDVRTMMTKISEEIDKNHEQKKKLLREYEILFTERHRISQSIQTEKNLIQDR